MYSLELAAINAYPVHKEAVKDPCLRILKFRYTLVKGLTCYYDDVPIHSAAVSNAGILDLSQYARIEEFHTLENIEPNASKYVFFASVEFVLNYRREMKPV